MNRTIPIICVMSILSLYGCSGQVRLPSVNPIEPVFPNHTQNQTNTKTPSITEGKRDVKKGNDSVSSLLPSDADRSNMQEQLELIKSGVYMTKTGEMALLPSTQSTRSYTREKVRTQISVQEIDIPDGQKVHIPLK